MEDIRIVTKKIVLGFSGDPNRSLYEILRTFKDNIIIHDYREFRPEQPEGEGWAIGYYCSHMHFWVIYIETNSQGILTSIKVAKYDADITKIRFFPEKLDLELLKFAEIPLDCEEACLIASIFNAKLPSST